MPESSKSKDKKLVIGIGEAVDLLASLLKTAIAAAGFDIVNVTTEPSNAGVVATSTKYMGWRLAIGFDYRDCMVSMCLESDDSDVGLITEAVMLDAVGKQYNPTEWQCRNEVDLERVAILMRELVRVVVATSVSGDALLVSRLRAIQSQRDWDRCRGSYK